VFRNAEIHFLYVKLDVSDEYSAAAFLRVLYNHFFASSFYQSRVYSMLSKINVVKAIVICAVVILLHTFYVTAVSLQDALVAEGQNVSKIEAMSYFMSYHEVWSGIFFGWAYDFVLSLISCLLLLLWIRK
jgi:hypothetical protein